MRKVLIKPTQGRSFDYFKKWLKSEYVILWPMEGWLSVITGVCSVIKLKTSICWCNLNKTLFEIVRAEVIRERICWGQEEIKTTETGSTKVWPQFGKQGKSIFELHEDGGQNKANSK